MRNLDIDLLRTLVTIADTGSFSAAAARLGRTQSAVSLQIKRLEDNVGQPLLQRSQGRVAGPTAEGAVIIDYGRRILRLNDEAFSCFVRPEFAGRLRLGLPEEVMERAFPRIQTAFVEQCPRVELSVRCDLSIRLVELLEAGELDVAVVKRIGAGKAEGVSEHWEMIRYEPLVWATGEGSNAIEQRPLPIGVFHEGCVFRTAAMAALASAEIPWRAAFVGSSFAALRHAVASGLALTPLPRSLVGAGLREVREGLPGLPNSEMWLGYAPGEDTAAARLLGELLTEALGEGAHQVPLPV